jgi:hypothetical protein
VVGALPGTTTDPPADDELAYLRCSAAREGDSISAPGVEEARLSREARPAAATRPALLAAVAGLPRAGAAAGAGGRGPPVSGRGSGWGRALAALWGHRPGAGPARRRGCWGCAGRRGRRTFGRRGRACGCRPRGRGAQRRLRRVGAQELLADVLKQLAATLRGTVAQATAVGGAGCGVGALPCRLARQARGRPGGAQGAGRQAGCRAHRRAGRRQGGGASPAGGHGRAAAGGGGRAGQQRARQRALQHGRQPQRLLVQALQVLQVLAVLGACRRGWAGAAGAGAVGGRRRQAAGVRNARPCVRQQQAAAGGACT